MILIMIHNMKATNFGLEIQVSNFRTNAWTGGVSYVGTNVGSDRSPIICADFVFNREQTIYAPSHAES